ncbi:MAG: response regulator, partial [Oscillospiraceae bacterium]
MRVAICEDSSTQLIQMQNIIKEYKNGSITQPIEVFAFLQGAELLRQMEKTRFDIYFVKAEMREGGIKIGEEIRKKDDAGVIVFIAESEIYAYKAFSIYAYQYLLSPVKPGKIFEIMDRVLKPKTHNSQRRFSVKTKESLLTIAYSDVVFIECRRHVLCFSLKDGSVVKSTHIRSSFEDATATILSDERFIHPHKS